MNRRRHIQEMEANRAAANIDGLKKQFFRSGLIIAYFLLCLYLPAMFGQTRNPLCKFNALKADNYFAFLLVGLMLASTVIDYIVYRVVCAKMQG